MRFTVKGELYEVDQERLSVQEAQAIKRATGLTIRGFLNGLREYDADALVALIWLARSRGGERISIGGIVEENFDVLQDFDLVTDDDEQGRDQGEDDEQDPTRGVAPPPSGPEASTIPPSTRSTPTGTGRTGSARSRRPSATPPPRSTR